MPAVVVVGAQWGDEGKGKVVDLLTDRADVVVRFGGGANAGHTLVIDGRKLVTHLIPSGVLHAGTKCVLGDGMVIDPDMLLEEIAACRERGLLAADELLISEQAHVILPYHRELEALREERKHAIGTTRRGIGPAYEAKVARRGVRVRDLLRPDKLRSLVAQNLEELRPLIAHFGGKTLDQAWVDDMIANAVAAGKQLEPHLGNAGAFVDSAIAANKNVLFEGAQGALLDIDHGTYPCVTSSATIAAGACQGTGIGPTRIDRVVGITKAYATRVGGGPFPTQLEGDEAESLREAGGEYGATTGRPRRCGWLDLPALGLAIRVNGMSSLALTKLDVLGGRHRVGNPPVITGPVYFATNIARDLEKAECASDGGTDDDLVVLDGFGMAHWVKHPECSIPQDFYFGNEMKDFPQGRAVDIEIASNSTGFWVLTDYGEIFRAGTAKNPGEPSALGVGQMGVLGFDVPITGEMRDSNLPDPGGASLRAVSFVVIDEDQNGKADGYVVLDSMGGRYQRQANGAFVLPGSSLGLSGNQPEKLLDPTAYAWPFFPGLDIARDVELHPTQQGVVILDGWGGIHPVLVDVEDNPVFFATNLTSATDTNPLQVPGMPYIQTGFDNPDTPEDESDAQSFGIDVASIFRDIEFSAGCSGGLYTLDGFGGVFVMGETREVPSDPSPQFGNSPYFFPLPYAEAIEVFSR